MPVSLVDPAEPIGPKAIADATGMKAANLRVLLRAMVAAGEITQPEYGSYTPITLVTPVTLAELSV